MHIRINARIRLCMQYIYISTYICYVYTLMCMYIPAQKCTDMCIIHTHLYLEGKCGVPCVVMCVYTQYMYVSTNNVHTCMYV